MAEGSSKYQIRLTASDETRAAFDSAKENIGGMDAPLNSLKSAFESIGAAAAATMVLSFAKTSIAAAEEANQAMLKLQAIYKATGGVVGFTTNELNKMADAMAETTHFDDEAIRNGMSEIIKFGNVTGKVFKDSLQVIADYAAFSGQAFPEAASAVARALADPETAAKLLKQAGVILTEQQKGLIRALKETGDEAGAQQVVLERLQGAYRGMEETMNGGLTGATKSLSKEWAELMEAFGKSSAGSANQVLGSVAFSIKNVRDAIAEAEAQDQKRIQNIGRFASIQISKPGESDTGPLAGKTIEDIQAAARETAATLKAAADQQDAAALKSLQKLLEEVEKFENELVASHDSAFTKIVNKYVEMEAQLAAAGAAGNEARMALQEAFTTMLDDEYTKRTDENNAADTKIIEAQQEKFMKMREQAEQASLIDKELADRKEQERYEAQLRQLEVERMVLEDKNLFNQQSQIKYNAAMEAIEKEHGARVTAIAKEEGTRRNSLEMQLAQGKISMSSQVAAAAAGFLNATGQKNSDTAKLIFAIQKGLAVAQAVVNTEMAATAALATGTLLGGPLGGASAAAWIRGLGYTSVGLIAATAMMEGGGGGSGGSMPTAQPGADLTSPPPPAPPQVSQNADGAPIPVQSQAAQETRTVNVYMHGEDYLMSAQAIREQLIPALNEAAGDGVTINVVTV